MMHPKQARQRRGKDILVPPSLTFGQFRPTRFTIKTLQTHKVCILDSSDLVGLNCPKCKPCGLNCPKCKPCACFLLLRCLLSIPRPSNFFSWPHTYARMLPDLARSPDLGLPDLAQGRSLFSLKTLKIPDLFSFFSFFFLSRF